MSRNTASRSEEIRKLLALSPRQLQNRAHGRLVILPDIEALHQHFAASIADETQENNQQGQPTRLILPVGPVGQYPILLELSHQRQISLKHAGSFSWTSTVMTTAWFSLQIIR